MNKFQMLLNAFRYKYSEICNNRIVFTSFDGHYSDNPKYIALAMKELDSSKEIIWLVKNQYMCHVPSCFLCADIDSSEGEKYRHTAAVIVDNVYGKKAYMVKKTFKSRICAIMCFFLYRKKGQKIYTTWHGTPLKKMGRDQIGNDIVDFVCAPTTMLGGNQFTLDIMQHLTFGKMENVLLGTPRNDILFSTELVNTALREKLGLPNDKKIILFAPTFRNDGPDVQGKNVLRSGINQLNDIDFALLFDTLSKKFGGEWVFVCRFHYHVAEMVDWEKLDAMYSGRIINGNIHDDMSEYLACADMLITDASSCMFDYMLTNKPCILFFPDVERYKNSERGLYMDIEELPFPLAFDFDELLSAIKDFSIEDYNQKSSLLLEKLHSVDDANSAQRIAKYILEKWNK